MSDPTLSPDQIDALFAAAEQGDLPSAPGDQLSGRQRSTARVTTVDFSRPNKFTKEQERQLRRAHETFCRTASTGLGADLRTPIDLDVIGVAQLNWSNAVLGIGQESVCAVVDVNPLGTKLLITIERIFILTLIERLCGGSLTGVAPDRPFSDIDEAMGKRIIRLFVDQLSLVWHEFADVSLDFVDVEPEPSSARIAGLSEPTLIVTVEVRMGKGSYAVGVMLPYSAIEQATGKFTSGEPEAYELDPAAHRAMRAAISDVAVELRAEVASIPLTADEILRLGVGDVIRLGPAAQGVTICADQTPLYRARPGRDGSRRAVQVQRGA